MSTSSISAPPPVQPTYTQPTPPVVNNDSDSDDAGAQPATRAPLPPGQGTRIDQLV
jgi:hypothetical protein